MSEWKTIESAPKDGTKILAWPCYSSGVHQVFWHEGPRRSGWKDKLGFVPVPPTHWIPTPAPPTPEAHHEATAAYAAALVHLEKPSEYRESHTKTTSTGTETPFTAMIRAAK